MSGIKILVIDDDAIFLMLTEKLLEKVDFNSHVETFNNGQVAVDYLKNHRAADDTYIVFLDLNMPVMDGWQFLDEIDSLGYDNLVVYIVTSSTDHADVERSKQYPLVKDYISKPMTGRTLAVIKEEYVNVE